NFVAFFASTYGKKLMGAWNTVSPRPPVFIPLYDGPSNVYSAIAPSLSSGDGFWISPNEVAADVKRIIAASPGTPLIVANYANANPDSPYAATPCPSAPGECYQTQETRGAGMVNFWKQTLHLQDVNSRYVVVGLEHWGFYDQANESTNFGLVTA